MADKRKLVVEIVGDTSSLERSFGQASKAGSGLGRGLTRLGKVAAFAGGAAALGGLAITVKRGFEEIAESQKVLAQTEAVLKSTGGAANVTAKQVGTLATSLSNLSGVDDELIQSGQNVLLTFTRVRNEVGAGNDVFNQATQATLNLSVALGKDMQSSAILVGKALNDPIKGMSALSRAGIQFTESQKETIKSLVESGNAMDAQKMILKELETQFGGSARAAGETLPGQLNKARNAFDEVSGQLMTALLPTLTSLLQHFNRLITWVQANMPEIRETFRSVTGAVTGVLRGLSDFFVQNLLPVLQRWWTFTMQAVSAVAAVFQKNGPEIQRILDRIGAAAKVVGTVLLWLADNVVIPILKPLFTVGLPAALNVTIKAIDVLTGSVEALINAFKWIAKNTASVFNKVKDAIEGPAVAIIGFLRPVANILFGIVGAMNDIINLAERVAGALSKLGGLVGSIPGLAVGGPVSAYTPYIVGEAGPELFVPATAGRIIPNSKLTATTHTGAAGGTVNVYVNGFLGPGAEAELARVIKRELTLDARRNVTSLGGLA